jgi:large subunit ribosomal protein L5
VWSEPDPEGEIPHRISNEETKMASRLRERYKEQIISALMKEFNYKNTMAVPRLEKVVLNMGVGREAQTNPKVFDQAAMELSTVSGQKPVITKAKKSIAAFKLRTGMPVGVAVTLRGDRMYEFLDRFINAVLPRVRDFRGISPRAFDGRGNYTIGIKDQLIFPEIDFNKVDRTRGMNISIVTTARTDEEGRALLKEFGMPFTK